MSTKRVTAVGLFLLALTSSAAAEEVQAYLGGSYPPQSGQSLPMSVWGASDIEVSEYRLSSAQLGEALRPNALQLDVAGLQASKTVRFNDQRGQVPVADAPGVYVYVARGSGVQRTQARAVVVSELKVAVKRDDDSSLFLVQRGERLASQPRILVYEAADHQSKPTLLRAYQGRSGVAYLRTPSTKSLIYVVESGGQFAIQTAHDRTWSANTARYQVHVSTDRPLYRPGHTANFKVIVRERVGDRSHRTPSDEEVRVLLRDPSGNKTSVLESKTNRFGTVSGSAAISEGAALGEYGLEVEVGPRQTGVTHPTTQGYASFGVQAYRKPEFKVEVAADAQIVQGSPVQAEVEARYFFGAPVANAQVEWTVTKRNRWRWWNPWIRPLVYDAMPSLWGPRSHDQVVARGEGTTDASGKLSLAVATQREDQDADYEITAEVVDAANREVKGGGSVAVTRAAFDLLLVSNRYCYEPGDLIELQANLQHLDGSAAAPTAVTFEIEELDKDGDATPRLTLDRMSDAQGEVSLRLRARTTNHYRVTARALDADGNEVSATRSFWIADETGARDWSFDRVELTADKDAYEPGDTAVILVRGPVSSGYGVVTVEGLEIKHAFGVRLVGGLGLVKIPVTEAMTPATFVSCLIAGDDQPQTGSVELNVPPVNKIVDVQVVADKAEYRPGETATFTLKTTDANGRPVAAEVALGVVDEALFALRDDAAPELAATFFPRDYNRVHTLGAASFGGGFFPGGPVFLETAVMAMARDSSRKSATGQQQSKVREYFPDTMLWLAHVETNAQGEATISQELADSLTTWRLTARAVTEQDELGQTKTTTLVRKDLIVRLAAPRALVEGDELELVGIVHNLAEEGAAGAENASVRLRLEAEGVELRDAANRTVIVPREGETEVTWRVRVREGKLATLTLRGDASFDSDALRLRLPIAARGVPAPRAISGSRVTDGAETFSLFKEAGAIDAASELKITLTPSLAGSLLDTLDYLAGYPYGCIEQTMSRFLPTLLVADTLKRIGEADPELEAELPKMVKAGIEKVRGHQNPDGGYGWFGSHRASHPFVSAYVAYGLALARQQGHAVPQETWDKLVAFLEGSLDDLNNTDLEGRAYQVFALAEGGVFRSTDMANLARDKDRLGDYAKAVLALALHRAGRDSMARDLVASLASSAVRLNGRAHWAGNTLRYGNWTSNPIETTAYALRALIELDGQNPLVRDAMSWLLSRRRGNRWTTTKDTAAVVMTFSHYVKVTGELNPDLGVAVSVNGQQVATQRFDAADLGKEAVTITVPGSALADGANQIEIRRTGQGALYFTALLDQWVRMSPIAAEDNGLEIKRDYYVVHERLDNGQLVEDELPFTGTVKAGETVRVKLTLEVTRAGDVEHVNFEDRFPAGFEVVEQERRAWGWWSYWRSAREVHDDRVVFFASQLNRFGGVNSQRYEYSYDLRAETTGRFLALPAFAEAVYAPGTNGRSAATEFVVTPN